MSDLQQAKAIVLAMNEALDTAPETGVADALSPFLAKDFIWRGMHPWNTLNGVEATADGFWRPIKQAFSSLQRRPDIFYAGTNSMDGQNTTWVVEMGHHMGLFDAPWLGIRPTRRLTFLRYAEFHRLTDGQIDRSMAYFDVPSVFAQAEVRWMPPQTGGGLLTPGPATHDGVLLRARPVQDGKKTLTLIEAMIADLVDHGVSSPRGHLDRFWTPDMCWFGPAGIGSSTGREGYRRGHTGPFEEGLEFVSHNGHELRVAEGNYGGFFGYPSLTMRSTGGFMGLTASERTADMRIVDLYRREGDRLAENWIFIDLLHFMKMLGVDVLERLRETGALIR